MLSTIFNSSVRNLRGLSSSSFLSIHSVPDFLDNIRKRHEQNSSLDPRKFSAIQQDLFYGLASVYRGCQSEEWKALVPSIQQHALKEIINQCPLNSRCVKKPWGYAGDAKALDLFYYDIPSFDVVTPIGKLVWAFTNATPAARAVRHRAIKIASMVDSFSELKKPRILSLACGHLRELSFSKKFQQGDCEVVALDQDDRSLSTVQSDYGHLGVTTVHAKVKKLLKDPTFVDSLGEFDLVYASGLFDYLDDEAAKALMKVMYRCTRESGTTLFTNFVPGIVCRAYMETYMDWWLIYRDTTDLLRLSRDLISETGGSFSLEPCQNIAFLSYRKSPVNELSLQFEALNDPPFFKRHDAQKEDRTRVSLR